MKLDWVHTVVREYTRTGVVVPQRKRKSKGRLPPAVRSFVKNALQLQLAKLRLPPAFGLVAGAGALRAAARA